MSADGHFDTTEHATAYKQFRSNLPKEVVRRILFYLEESFVPSQCVGVDVGCGSGQSTLPMSDVMEKMIGIDTSEAQLAAISEDKPSNVEFKLGSSDSIPVKDNSVHLVMAVNAAHWFNLQRFFTEVDRVLMSKGIVALIRGTPRIELEGAEEKTQNLFDQLVTDTIDYWDQHSLFRDYLYKKVSIPYRMNVRDESVITEEKVTLAYVLGRVKTFSGIAKFFREDPVKAQEVVAKYQSNLLKEIGAEGRAPEDITVTLRRQFIILLGRKP